MLHGLGVTPCAVTGVWGPIPFQGVSGYRSLKKPGQRSEHNQYRLAPSPPEGRSLFCAAAQVLMRHPYDCELFMLTSM